MYEARLSGAVVFAYVELKKISLYMHFIFLLFNFIILLLD
jgi:hypothetical protein